MAVSRFVAVSMALLVVACSQQADDRARTESAADPVSAAPPPRPAEPEYEEPLVGGARLATGSAILSGLAQSKEHVFMVKALAASGLDRDLAGSGPFTVFAPTDAAFAQWPGGPESLLAPAARERLDALLRYHVVPGKLDAFELGQRVAAGNGSAMLKTLQGESLKATIGDGAALVVDAKGNVARITVPNVLQANGVLHVVDRVMEPASQ